MSTRYADWRDEQSQQTYPFQDHSFPVTPDGRELPPGVILDALIHAPGSTGGYVLASLEMRNDRTRFEIFDGGQGATVSGEKTNTDTQPDAVQLRDAEGRNAGVLVVDPVAIERLRYDWGEGVYVFETSSSGFVPSTWDYTESVDPPIVQFGVSVPSQGDIYLVGDRGVWLEYQEIDGRPTILIHAIGDPLGKRASCEDVFETPRFIQEVVFQAGSKTHRCTPENGVVNIMAVSAEDSAFRIHQDSSQIRIGFASKTPW